MYLRLFFNLTRVQHVGAETRCESEKRKRLFSGDHLKIKPLMRSAPIVLCTQEVSLHKAKMHHKLEHIFVYGWGAQLHRAASYPIRKLPGFPPPSKVPVILTWRSFFSYSAVAMFLFFFSFLTGRCKRKASVWGVTKALEIVSSQHRWQNILRANPRCQEDKLKLMNNRLKATDAAICRPYNRSLDMVFFSTTWRTWTSA